MSGFGLASALAGFGAGLTGAAVAGVLAGLAGLGGGLIYVPLLYLAMPASAGRADGHLGVEVFASMTAVIVTGFFSARSHWRLHHVDGRTLAQILPGLALGAGIGLWATLQVPQAAILAGLALLDGWIALDYGRARAAASGLSAWARRGLALPIGLIAGALGIGGGTMLAPLLRGALPLRQAVGTASAAGFLMALAAVILNLAAESGWQRELAPHGAFLAGFLIGILVVLPRATAWGAGLHARIEEHVLRAGLRGLFLALACLMAAMAVARI